MDIDYNKITLVGDVLNDENEGTSVGVKVPDRHSTIADFDAPDEHEKYTKDDVYQYFNNLSDGRFCLIEGVTMDYTGGYDCDYCKVTIVGKRFYCRQCIKDMCKLCHSETSEEIAIGNGAKNYKNRAEALATCRSHTLVERNDVMPYRSCNVCQKYIGSNAHWHNDNDYDLCMTCADGSALIEQHGLTYIESESPFKESGFGSMLDWVPVLRDSEYNLVLYNINIDSEHHRRYCLSSVDDHGRRGYFVVYDVSTIDEILAELNKIVIELKEGAKYLDKWDKFYNMPIKVMMNNRGMPFHYG